MSFVRIDTSLTLPLTLTLGSPRVNQGQEPLAQSRALNPTTLCTLISGLLYFYSGYYNIIGSLYYHMRVRISVLLPVIYQFFRLPSASNVARAISWSTACPSLSCTICFANSLTCGSVLIWEMRISFQIRLDKGNRGGESKSVGLGFRCLMRYGDGDGGRAWWWCGKQCACPN